MALLAGFGATILSIIILITARERIIDNARLIVSQHAKVMSSHAEASLDAVRVLLETLSSDMRGRDLHAIPEAAGREMLRTRISGALAEVRNMSIMDKDGRQLFLSSGSIGGDVMVADRNYFLNLKTGQRISASGPYIGRNSGQPTYGLAYRIDDDRGEMSGLAHAAIRPSFFEKFCMAVRPLAEMDAAMVSDTGEVIATCDADNPFMARPIAELPQFHPTPLLAALLPAISVQVPSKNYPLKIVVALSGRSIASAWRWEFLFSCLSSGLILLVSTMIIATIFRQYRNSHRRTAQEMDLLEQKVAERTVELQKAKQAAERANAAKSAFLAAASHDLRQPFQAMLLLKEALDVQLVRPEDRKILAVLSTAMDAGQELLNALLHISTLEAGVVKPQMERVNLGEIFASLAQEFGQQAERNHIELRSVTSIATVSTDPVLFRRMLANLVGNALKYSTRGKVLLGVRHRANGILRVEVWDTGPGVPEDRQSEIWEAFVQLHNPERDRTKGLGLGLAIVAKTADLLDHPVSMRSWPGRGSVFRVDVKADAGNGVPGPQSSRMALKSSLPPSGPASRARRDSTPVR